MPNQTLPPRAPQDESYGRCTLQSSVDVLVQIESRHKTHDGDEPRIAIGRYYYNSDTWSVPGWSTVPVVRWWPLPTVNEGGFPYEE